MPASRLLLVLLLLAGCAGDDGAPTGPTVDHSPAAAFASGAYSAEGCIEGGIVLLVSPAAAQAMLPEGFVPRDASDLFGLPLPSGRAALYLNAQRCDSTNVTADALFVAQVNVYVEGPSELAPAYDFYELTFSSPNPEVGAHFATANWTGAEEEVTVTQDSGPLGASSVGGASMFAFDIRGPLESPLQGIGRFWRATDAGLPYVEHHLATTLAAGTVTCTLQAGSPWAEANGGPSCRPGDSVGLILHPFDYVATFHYA